MRHQYIIGFMIFIGLAFTLPVFAAELYFGTETENVGLHNQFEVGVFINTDEQRINAFEGVVEFDRELVELVEIKDGGSLVNFWVEKPEKDNPLFSGISPGGYQGKRGYLFSLIFTAKKVGEFTISMKDERVLLHDGEGSVAELKKAPLRLNILKEVFLPGYFAPEDVEAPEAFIPSVMQDPNVFDGEWFMVFATQDKVSGLDYYEVKEQREYGVGKMKFGMANWEIVKSPYLLKDQKRKSTILLRAIDRQGNIRNEKIYAQNPLSWYENYFIWVILTVGIIVFLFLRGQWTKKKSKKIHT